VRHGEGVLGHEQAEPEPAGQWPPDDAEPVSLDGLYPRLIDRGLRYGPAFQGLRAAWCRAEEIFAQVTCPVDARGFVVHPALLDSALHALGFAGDGTAPDSPLLPFTWSGVTAYATQPSTLRVRLRGSTDGTVRLTATDEAGAPVLSVDGLVLRAAAARSDAPRDALFRTKWIDVRATSSTASHSVVAVGTATDQFPTFADLDAVEAAVAAGRPVPDAVLVAGTGDSVRDAAHRALNLVRWWVMRPEFAGSTLVFLTSGAIAARNGDAVDDLPGAAVTGLVRSAQTEEPGRFVLLDADEITPSTIAAALTADEPELALRAGVLLARRLVRVFPPAPARFADAEDVVLITGGTGTLGGLLARHLVTAHGVRNVVLIGRSGRATELVDELTGLGAVATAVACDVTDRAALAALIEEHRPTIVVHAAGTLDDGVVMTMTEDRLDGVLAPKAEAALILHELTKDAPLKAFVLFSSAAAAVGSGGQSNYAAANTVLDALAQHRHAHGLPAASLAWGLWAERSQLTRHLDQSLAELSTVEALALFDAAVSHGDPVLVPARFTMDADQNRPLLRELFGHRAGAEGGVRSLLDLLEGQDLEQALVNLVLDKVALVLGHDSAAHLSPNAGFLEMGVDSLAAVRIRNHLAEALNLRLRATATFDHPTPVVLAQHLSDLLAKGEDDVAPEQDPAHVRERIIRARASGWEKTRTFVTSMAEVRKPPRPVRLTKGTPGTTALVCVTGIVGKSHPVQFLRLAKLFRGARDVWAIPQPGFRRDEALPRTPDLLLDMHAAGLRAELGDRPFVLAGLSSGGLVAHLIAERLHALGTPPAGVIALDTYVPSESERLVRLLPVLGEELQHRLDNPNRAVPGDEGWVTAMLHYMAFDWTPTALPVPELFVRAADPLAGWPPDWEPVWPFEHTLVVTPGNHFTMLEEEAPHAAALMNDWMRDTLD
jgi:hypothetical protein